MSLLDRQFRAFSYVVSTLCFVAAAVLLFSGYYTVDVLEAFFLMLHTAGLTLYFAEHTEEIVLKQRTGAKSMFEINAVALLIIGLISFASITQHDLHLLGYLVNTLFFLYSVVSVAVIRLGFFEETSEEKLKRFGSITIMYPSADGELREKTFEPDEVIEALRQYDREKRLLDED